MQHPYYRQKVYKDRSIVIWTIILFVLILALLIPWLLPGNLAQAEPLNTLKTVTTFPVELEWEHIEKYEPQESQQNLNQPLSQPAASQTQPESDSYFPLRVGNKWTYEHISTGSMMNPDDKVVTLKTIEITDRFQSGDLTIYNIEITENGKTETAYYFRDSEGLKLTFNPDHPYRRAALILKENPRVNDSWKEGGMVSPTNTVIAEEQVEVPAGQFQCILVEYKYSKSSYARHLTWYAKGVGIINQHHGIPAKGTDEWKLVEFTQN